MSFLRETEWHITHEPGFECPECCEIQDETEVSDLFYTRDNKKCFVCKTCKKKHGQCNNCGDYYYKSYLEQHKKQCKKKSKTDIKSSHTSFICGVCYRSQDLSLKSNLFIEKEEDFPWLCKSCSRLFIQCKKCKSYTRTRYHGCACKKSSKDIIRNIND